MEFNASVEIAQSFDSQIAAIVRVLGTEAIEEPLLAGGWIVASEAKRLARFKTGTLRRSIRAELVEPGLVIVGTEVAYGRRIEFGFIGADSLGRNYHQAPSPYLRPAFRTKKEEAMDTVKAGIRDVIQSRLG